MFFSAMLVIVGYIVYYTAILVAYFSSKENERN